MGRRADEPVLEDGGRSLRWDLSGDHEVAGWSLRAGPADGAVRRVQWFRATSGDLGPCEDVDGWVDRRVQGLGAAGVSQCVLLTSRALEAHVLRREPFEGGEVEVLATVGLGNALRVGDPASPQASAGTINVALRVPVPIESGARAELLSLIAEAKAAEMIASRVPSKVSAALSTGTGTDCAVVVSPMAEDGGAAPLRYAGKHTELGAAVGRAVSGALREGIASSRAESDGGAARLVLVGGGARSGKSGFAEARTIALAAGRPGRAVYVATAQAFDDEMAERIQRHRRDRGDTFDTVEEPIELPACLRSMASEPPAAVLVECLTLWMSNLLLADLDDDALEARAAELVDAVRSAPFHVVLVTNEVGLGIVPESSLGRRFRDAAGRLHQRLSAVADEVHFAALGTVLRLSPGPVELSRPQGG